MRIVHVIGARPNFVKVAPVMRALKKHSFEQVLIHTGQHYDVNMSDIFFRQLELPAPDLNLEVGSGTHTEQTAQVMMRCEKAFASLRPDLVMVYGDVNSTVAAAFVCAKLQLRLAHVEAGLRSFDRSMPEEVNRIITDQLSDLLFTPSEDANLNLAREGISPEKIKLVGNVMIDTLVRLLPAARLPEGLLLDGRYVLVTLHRPGNVDHPVRLKTLMTSLAEISRDLQVVFPVHPRTRNRINELGLTLPDTKRLNLREPLGYLEFLALQQRASLVLTDSGGVQEETTYLGVPCLTIRPNTERPVTITHGTNKLIGDALLDIPGAVGSAIEAMPGQKRIPPLWDGHAAERIAAVLAEYSSQ